MVNKELVIESKESADVPEKYKEAFTYENKLECGNSKCPKASNRKEKSDQWQRGQSVCLDISDEKEAG